MTAVLIVVIVLLGAAFVALATAHFVYRERRPVRGPATATRRILFPFVANALSARALDAALRLANAESATLVPVFLARVPMQLPLETPLPRQSAVCLPLLEAIEQRAAEFEVPVDARVERGRSYRHALRQAVAHERFDRIVVAAGANGNPGFDTEDVAWLLDAAPGEIIVLRPGTGELVEPVTPAVRRRSEGARALTPA